MNNRKYSELTGDKMKQNTRRLTLDHILIVMLLAGAAIVFAFLSYAACRYSYYTIDNNEFSSVLIPDASWKHIVLFALAAYMVYAGDVLLQKQSKQLRERTCKLFLYVSCALIFVLGCVYVVGHPYYPQGDQINTTAFAVYARGGNYLMLQPGGYVGMYEQQKNLGFLYEVAFTIFGDFNYLPIQIIHIGWWILAVVAGYGFLQINAARAIFRPVYCIFMTACIPFLFYLPYAYGDLMSISFGIVLFWAVSAHEQQGGKRYLFIAAGAGILAMLARKNTLILFVALAIYFVLLCIRRKKLKYLLSGALVILSSFVALSAVSGMYRHRSGYESGCGIPSILWVAMGMQETNGHPGIYNRFQQTIFEQAGGDVEESKRVGKAYVRGRLSEFRHDPVMALDFVKRKVEEQWIEPLYESLCSTKTFGEDSEVPSYIEKIYYGEWQNLFWRLSNFEQSICYFSVLLFIVASIVTILGQKSETPLSLWLPLIAAIGGFLFSIIWEAKSRYMLPYYAFLILYVPEGLYQITVIVRKIRRNQQPKKGGDSQEKTEDTESELQGIA